MTKSGDVHPRDVAGFDDAVARGLVPVVSTDPPALLPGASAHAVVWGYITRVGVVVGAWILAMLVLGVFDSAMATVLRLVALAVSLVGFWRLFVVGRARAGERLLEELDAGYATFRPAFGGFWRTRQASRPTLTYQEPWDFRGTWQLSSTGAVVGPPPDRSVLAPGFYPSPNRPGSLELWTGAAWGSVWRTPAVPFDDVDHGRP